MNAAANAPAGAYETVQYAYWWIGSIAVLAFLAFVMKLVFSALQDGSFSHPGGDRQSERTAEPKATMQETAAIYSAEDGWREVPLSELQLQKRASASLRDGGHVEAADELRRLFGSDLAPLRRDQVMQVMEAIDGAATTMQQIPERLRDVATDDGTSPRQDYQRIIGLASAAVASMTDEEAALDIDQVRVLRRYAEQWAPNYDELTVGTEVETDTNREGGK